MLVRGANGAGKSTLLRAMLGDDALDGDGAGARHPRGGSRCSRARGARTRRRASACSSRTSRSGSTSAASRPSFVGDAARAATGDDALPAERVRAVLGALGLSQDKALRAVGALSGGEKARVALAILALTPNNVLALDEPSNHLDAATIGALVDAPRAGRVAPRAGEKDGAGGQARAGGALVVVSHDRAFCEAMAPWTHVVTLGGGDGGVRVEARDVAPGDWDVGGVGARERVGGRGRGRERRGASAAAASGDGAMSKEEAHAARRAVANAPKRIKKIEDKIEKLEGKLAGPRRRRGVAAAPTSASASRAPGRQDGVQAEVDGLYAEWEERRRAYLRVARCG